jgi:hypothetical protein
MCRTRPKVSRPYLCVFTPLCNKLECFYWLGYSRLIAEEKSHESTIKAEWLKHYSQIVDEAWKVVPVTNTLAYYTKAQIS